MGFRGGGGPSISWFSSTPAEIGLNVLNLDIMVLFIETAFQYLSCDILKLSYMGRDRLTALYLISLIL